MLACELWNVAIDATQCLGIFPNNPFNLGGCLPETPPFQNSPVAMEEYRKSPLWDPQNDFVDFPAFPLRVSHIALSREDEVELKSICCREWADRALVEALFAVPKSFLK